MAEPKRHTDVPKERVLERPTHPSATTHSPNKIRGNPDSEGNHHKTH